jgi:hypothetical protein
MSSYIRFRCRADPPRSCRCSWWFYWFHAFSAAVCLGAICIRAPASPFASPAYMSLVTACDLAQAAVSGTKAKSGLVS